MARRQGFPSLFDGVAGKDEYERESDDVAESEREDGEDAIAEICRRVELQIEKEDRDFGEANSEDVEHDCCLIRLCKHQPDFIMRWQLFINRGCLTFANHPYFSIVISQVWIPYVALRQESRNMLIKATVLAQPSEIATSSQPSTLMMKAFVYSRIIKTIVDSVKKIQIKGSKPSRR